nr:uncharacterized protein LOC128703685 [Cherax quadricarinatus]
MAKSSTTVAKSTTAATSSKNRSYIKNRGYINNNSGYVIKSSGYVINNRGCINNIRDYINKSNSYVINSSGYINDNRDYINKSKNLGSLEGEMDKVVSSPTTVFALMWDSDEEFLGKFGRGDRNFLRFGRSVDRQKSSMSFENCDEEPKTHDVTSTPSPTPVQPMTRTKQQAATHSIASSDSDKTTSHRMKRNVSRVYGYITLPTHTRDINPEEDAINVAYSDEPQVVDKRGYNKGFLRFGRDRNFLRFGKRDVSGEYPTYSSISSSESSGSQLGERPARAHQRNFIRFG